MNKEEMIATFKNMFPQMWREEYADKVNYVRPGIIIIYVGKRVTDRAFTFVFRNDGTWSLLFS